MSSRAAENCSPDDKAEISRLRAIIEEQDKEIRKQKAKLRAIADNISDVVMIFAADGSYEIVSQPFCDFHQLLYAGMENIGDLWKKAKLYDLEDRPVDSGNMPPARIIRGETIENETLKLLTGSHVVYYQISGWPLYDDEGNFTAGILCIRDLTESVRSREIDKERNRMLESRNMQLQQLNSQLRRQADMLNLSNEAIMAWKQDGSIIYWNKGAERMYGYTSREALGQVIHTLLCSRFTRDVAEVKAQVRQTGSWEGEIIHKTKNGDTIFVEARFQRIFDEDGQTVVLETNRDITRRIEAENSVKSLSEALLNIIESTDDLIWSVDKDFKIITSNSSVKNYIRSNYGSEPQKGSTMTDILGPELGGVWTDFYLNAVKNGSYQVDYKSKKDDQYFTFSFNPVYIDGKLEAITVFGKNITRRIQAEREIIRLNKKLENRVKDRTDELETIVAELQGFSAAAAHDLKTPLREIEHYIKQIRAGGDIGVCSDKIEGICRETVALIDKLLYFVSHMRLDIRKKPVNIKKVIVSAYEQLITAMQVQKSVLDFETGLPCVQADEELLRQVVGNILSNALKFSRKRDMIKITVGCREEHNAYVFYVKDNGVGFDMARADKLFRVFNRLHDREEYEGCGIGLAMVRNIIELHGGRTWIESIEDAGTTVYFTLPV